MTKKHFVMAAGQIAMIENIESRKQAANVIIFMGYELNPRFNKEVFLKACNL